MRGVWLVFVLVHVFKFHRCKSDVVDAHLIIQSISNLRPLDTVLLGSHQLHASKKSTENDSSSCSDIAVRVSASHDAFIDLSFDALIVK